MTYAIVPTARGGGGDGRETSPDYAWTVAALDAAWRVVESRDGLQWIIQRARRNSSETRWYSHYYFRSSACLLRYIGELEGRGELKASPSALATLAELPAWIETRRAKASEPSAP